MNRFVFLCMMSLLISCNTETGNIDNGKGNDETSSVTDVNEIKFPSQPIVLFDNLDVNKQLINYFNIVQVKDDLYYMYYQAFDKDVIIRSSFDQKLYFAYSTDGIHWTHESQSGGANLIMEDVVETSVFIVPDAENPFRLIGTVVVEPDTPKCRNLICMWKSKDGFNFNEKQVLLDGQHDTQHSMIVYKDYMKLFTREWLYRDTDRGKKAYCRKISTCTFDLQGKQLSSLEMLSPDYVYNPAASYFKGNEILFPTYYNNIDGDPDICYVKSYVITEGALREIKNNFNSKLTQEENWVIVSPGLIEIGGKLYISYNTRTASHSSDDYGISTYKILEVVFE